MPEGQQYEKFGKIWGINLVNLEVEPGSAGW